MDLNNLDTVDGILETVKKELERFDKGPAHLCSKHEAYAVALDGLDKMWECIKTGTPDSLTKAYCVRVAAVMVKMLQSPIWG